MVKRRDALKLYGAGALSLSTSQAMSAPDETGRPRINVAGYPYDRVQSIKGGSVGLDQAEVHFHDSNIYDMNDLAFGPNPKYEVTEIGLIPYITKYINEGFRGYTLVPIFISRTFRHRNIYVHVDSGIKKPEDLRGRKVGTPGYGSSANTWVRGMLNDQYGIPAKDIQWIEATASSDVKGAVSTSNGSGSRYQLADDFPLISGPSGMDESELLLSRKCDALITPITPRAFEEGNPNIRQLFSPLKQAEQKYFRETGVFPIMHAIAIRKKICDAYPWLPVAVVHMYSKAKQIAYDNLATTTVLRTSLPWTAEEFVETQEIMGDDYWRYGIEANRKELELVMRYTYEQGLVKKHADFMEMFHPDCRV